MNKEPTIEAIQAIAKTFRHYANELDHIARQMKEKNDISYTSEALQAIQNYMGNLRLDLLFTRPFHEMQIKK